MKLLRYTPHNVATDGEPRLGVLLSDERIGDVRAVLELLGRQSLTPARKPANSRNVDEAVAFLQAGEVLRDEVVACLSDPSLQGKASSQAGGRQIIRPVSECRLHAPITPGKIVAIGRNYPEHVKEDPGSRTPTYIPSCWIKANSSMTGPYDDIVMPACVREFDYENELCVVIGNTCKNVAEADAYRFIAGYTIMNDLSARDIIRLERREGNLLMGKMFEGFAPMGPWIVTADEIADPMNLRIRTRVNGEVRQDGNSREMIWPIAKLVSYLSQMRLDPGDIISTGTPSGTGLGRRKDEAPWWLNVGDVLESEVVGIGVMRNRIVAASGQSSPWQWPEKR